MYCAQHIIAKPSVEYFYQLARIIPEIFGIPGVQRQVLPHQLQYDLCVAFCNHSALKVHESLEQQGKEDRPLNSGG